MHEQIIACLRKNNIINKDQHGFLPKRSRVTNLLRCMNDWTLNFDDGKQTDVIYLDYSKCFDSVCHNKLLYKLSKYGFAGSAYKWIESFLTNRVQQVKVNNSLSEERNVISGVPQGTVLGPLLFLIFSADISSVVQYSKLSMYADDTKLYKKINNFLDCMLFQIDLNNVCQWATKWQLCLNPSKTKFICIGNEMFHFDYKINDNNIEKCFHVNDLGVKIQSNLKFTIHCNNVIKKALYN